jgi:GT2 family glycosyltransferase
MTTDPHPRISVVIPHLNQADYLKNCLESLTSGRLQPDEILVVDNGSRALPHDVCAAFPGVTLLTEATPGPGPARNRGVAAATGEILAFIDADCLASPNWLWTAREAMADPGAQILGGDVRIALADPKRMTMLEAYEAIYAYRMDRYIAREGFTGTGNLVVRRSVLDKVGPFAGLDVAEDRDWGQRATRAGFSTRYVADMKVYHPARANFRDLVVKWERHSAHDYVKAQGKPGGRAVFLLKTLAMVPSPLAEIPRIMASDRVSGLRNKLAAFVCLSRIRFRRAVIMFRLIAGTDPKVYSGAWNRAKP